VVGYHRLLGKGWWVGSWDSPTEKVADEADNYYSAIGGFNSH